MRHRGEEIHHMSLEDLASALAETDEADPMAYDLIDAAYNRLAERTELLKLDHGDFGRLAAALFFFATEGNQSQRSLAIDCLSAVPWVLSGNHSELSDKWVKRGGVRYGPVQRGAPRPEAR